MDQITPKPVKQFKVIGTRPLRPDGIEKVTGKAIYGADLSAPNMLYGLMLRINEPHALIESIDISIAEKLPGVKSIITFKDFIKINPDNKATGEPNPSNITHKTTPKKKVITVIK